MNKRRFTYLALILLLTGLMVYLFFPPLNPSPSLNHAKLRTAVWMDVTWSMDEYASDEITQLANTLQSQNVDDVYVYVSYLKAGDFFNPTYDFAKDFVATLKQSAPDIRILAWIGIPISITQPDGTFIANRLKSEDIRQQIAEFSQFMITDLGFDGLHLNAELIPNDDTAFLETLKLIDEILPTDAIFSTTAHALRLDHPVTASPYPNQAHHWNADYLQQVAQHVDQIALMAYDSGLTLPRDYLDWMTYQVTASQQALMDSSTELMIGLPTSEEWTGSHQTQAETLAIALNGIYAGYTGRVDGIAIYPYWDTDKDEWQLITNSINTSDLSQ